jgi:phage tail sheath protein FI
VIRAAFLSDFGPARLDSAFDVQYYAHRPTLRHALDGWFACGGGTCYVMPPSEFARHEVEVVCYPELAEHAPDRKAWQDEQWRMFAMCETAGDRLAIVDTPPDLTVREALDWRRYESGADTAFGALYYPWVRVAGPSGELVTVPPCGHVAGALARAGTTANVALEGVLDIAVDLTGNELDLLIQVGINPLRAMGGWGIRPWAARTLSSDPDSRTITLTRPGRAQT